MPMKSISVYGQTDRLLKREQLLKIRLKNWSKFNFLPNFMKEKNLEKIINFYHHSFIMLQKKFQIEYIVNFFSGTKVFFLQ